MTARGGQGRNAGNVLLLPLGLVLLFAAPAICMERTDAGENALEGKAASGKDSAAYHVEAPPERTSTYVDYRFDTAPTDWRAAAGTWDVTSRWQSDPRWTFFSGQPEDDNKLALIWNKRRFTDPIRIELYAAFKMQRERGNRYEYARDINVSLSSNGDDTLSGYSFVFGGFDNQKNAIIRKDKIVASTEDGLIKRSLRIHRRWFHIVVEKDGDDITFNVDDGRVKLHYKDPEPIDAGRVAIWSYDCGIMVGRVRISGGGGEMTELPGFAADGVPNTIYDTKLEDAVIEKEEKK